MPDESGPVKGHRLIELDEDCYQVLVRWMRTTGRSYSTVSVRALEQFEQAEWRVGPVPPKFDWSDAEELEKRGYSIADQIYDNLPKKKDGGK
jgi:hypothetical protein